MAQLPTVDDVAQRAGVSRQTVSNVLNSPDIVREATRERVRVAIAELGYRPHASARRLRTRQSSMIGVRLDPVINGISGSVLDRYLHALTARADERGMRITLFTADDHDAEIEQYQRLRDGADVDAFVVTATSYDDPRIEWLARGASPLRRLRPAVGQRAPRRSRATLGRRRRTSRDADGDRAPARPGA